MGFKIIEKRTFELNRDEITSLAGLINRNLYDYSCKNAEETFFSYPNSFNFLIQNEEDSEIIGIFQMRELKGVKSFYFMSAAIESAYRGNAIYNKLTRYRLSIVKEHGGEYVGTASTNPRVIGNLIRKHGFHFPKEKDSGLLQKAKDILMEAEKTDYNIKDNFVIPGHSLKNKYPLCIGREEFDDKEIEEFIKENMDNGAGDRLFLIKKMI